MNRPTHRPEDLLVRYWNDDVRHLSFLGIPKTGSSTVRASLGIDVERGWTVEPTHETTFTMIREPMSRLKSAYQECRRRGTLRPGAKEWNGFPPQVDLGNGYKAVIYGHSDIADPSNPKGSLPALHIISVIDDEAHDVMIGGFYRSMTKVEALLKSHGASRYALEAMDDKRQRVFARWACRRGARVLETTDFFGDRAWLFEIA